MRSANMLSSSRISGSRKKWILHKDCKLVSWSLEDEFAFITVLESSKIHRATSLSFTYPLRLPDWVECRHACLDHAAWLWADVIGIYMRSARNSNSIKHDTWFDSPHCGLSHDLEAFNQSCVYFGLTFPLSWVTMNLKWAFLSETWRLRFWQNSLKWVEIR